MLDDVVAGDKVDHLGVQAPRELHDELVLAVGLTAVTDQPTQTHATGVRVLEDASGDVVRRVHRHHLTGGHDVDLLGLALADRHREATAHDVTQDVVADEVEVLVGAVLLEEGDRGDDTTTRAPDTRLRTTGLDAADVELAGQQHILELEVLDRAPLRGQGQNRGLRLRVQDQTGRVRLRVAANDHDAVAAGGQRRHRVLLSGGLTNTTLAVKGDLPHRCVLLHRTPERASLWESRSWFR